MVYVLIGDETLEQLEALGLPRNARLLNFEAMFYCSRHLTDGRITIRMRRISDAPQLNKAVQELIDAGVWEKTEDGFLITDYLNTQRSSEEVNKNRERVARNQRRSRLHKQGDHSLCIKGRVCPNGVLDWDGQPLQGDSAIVTGDTPRPIQSNTLQSEPKARIGEIETKKADAIAFTPKGRERYASVMKEVHIFVDYKSTGICHLCEEGKNWKFHQRNIPARIQEFANDTAETGIPWEYQSENECIVNPDRDRVDFTLGGAYYLSLKFSPSNSQTVDEWLTDYPWFQFVHHVMLMGKEVVKEFQLDNIEGGDRIYISFSLPIPKFILGTWYLELVGLIENLLIGGEWFIDDKWLADDRWLQFPDWPDNDEWLGWFVAWIRTDEFLQAANANPDKYRGVLSLVNHDKVQAHLNRGQE